MSWMACAPFQVNRGAAYAIGPRLPAADRLVQALRPLAASVPSCSNVTLGSGQIFSNSTLRVRVHLHTRIYAHAPALHTLRGKHQMV